MEAIDDLRLGLRLHAPKTLFADGFSSILLFVDEEVGGLAPCASLTAKRSGGWRGARAF